MSCFENPNPAKQTTMTVTGPIVSILFLIRFNLGSTVRSFVLQLNIVRLHCTSTYVAASRSRILPKDLVHITSQSIILRYNTAYIRIIFYGSRSTKLGVEVPSKVESTGTTKLGVGVENSLKRITCAHKTQPNPT
jgi:hypothetical protein